MALAKKFGSAIEVLAVVGLVGIILLFGLYQGFVDQTHQRLGLKTFLSSAFWHQVAERSWSQDPVFFECDPVTGAAVSDFASEFYKDAAVFSTKCEQGCSFLLDPMLAAEYQWPSSTPVVTHRHSQLDTAVTQVELLAADLNSRRMLYQTAGDDPRFQFIEVPVSGYPHLWQEVDVTPNPHDTVQFVQVARSQQGQDFAVFVSAQRREIYLFGLDSLWLRKASWPTGLNDWSDAGHNELLCHVAMS